MICNDAFGVLTPLLGHREVVWPACWYAGDGDHSELGAGDLHMFRSSSSLHCHLLLQ